MLSSCVQIGAWWGEYPLAVWQLREGEVLTAGDQGDLALDGELWDLVRSEGDRARVLLRDGMEVLSGVRDRLARSPYRESPRGRSVMVELGEAVEVRVGACRVAVAVERADLARVARDGWISRRMIGPIGAALALCGSILGAGAFFVPPMVSFCDEECEIKEQARDIRPYIANVSVASAAGFDPRPVSHGDGLLPPDERDEYCNWMCRHGEGWGTTFPWASKPWVELLRVESDACGLERQACCQCEVAAIE